MKETRPLTPRFMPTSVSLDDILTEFADLDDRSDQANYLIELGEALPPFPDAFRTEANRVQGCQSQVWFVADVLNGSGRLRFRADSDAPIVSGLVAVLLAAYSEKTPREIVDLDIEATFRQLQLQSLLSPMRSNGLASMVLRIKELARRQLAAAEPRETPAVAEVLPSRPTRQFDIAAIRADFPILQRTLERGRKLVYLDNGASTQRPTAVLEAMLDVEQNRYGNVHRAGHTLAAETTERFEQARESIRKLLNARKTQEIIFTAGTTAGINLVARSWGDANVRAGDEILLTTLEHHSNIVPWQQLAARTGARIVWVPFDDNGEVTVAAVSEKLSAKTKLVALAAISNVLGTITPVREIITQAHAQGAKVLVDAAQSVPHMATDVQQLDCDFLAFSGHKMAGPTGIGALYAKEALLLEMPPFLGGGSMIQHVTCEGFTPADLPHKFEAGTPAIVPAIGLGAAVEYLQAFGFDAIHAHEQELTALAYELVAKIPGVRILGPEPAKRGGLLTFVVAGKAASDIAWQLDGDGIAVRAGHHCALPLHQQLEIPASCRASFYLYNTREEVEQFASSLQRILSR